MCGCFYMTEKQLKLFERYQHLVPEKIAKYAPEYIDDEDFRQDALVRLMEYIIEKSDTFEQLPRHIVGTYVHGTLSNYVKGNRKRLEKSDQITCSYEEIINEKDESSPFSSVDYSLVNFHIAQVMSTLTLRERYVLAIRFGFLGRTATLEETGNLFGVSKDRIRQIENHAIRKMRQSPRAKILRDFYI